MTALKTRNKLLVKISHKSTEWYSKLSQ